MAQALRLTVGVKLLTGHHTAHVVTVDESQYITDKTIHVDRRARDPLQDQPRTFELEMADITLLANKKRVIHLSAVECALSGSLAPTAGQTSHRLCHHIQRHSWCWHAHLTVTSEERGDAHFGEPCSWWQTAEVKHLAKLGATRGA